MELIRTSTTAITDFAQTDRGRAALRDTRSLFMVNTLPLAILPPQLVPQTAWILKNFLFILTRRRLYVTVARLHREIWLAQTHANLTPLAVRNVCTLWVVAQCVLPPQLFSDTGKRIRQLLCVVCLIQTAAGSVSQRAQILTSAIIIGLGCSRQRRAAIQRYVVSLLRSRDAKRT